MTKTIGFCILLSMAVLRAQEGLGSKAPSCLIVARYGTDGLFFYRDQYGVPADRLQLAYSPEELSRVLKSGVKVVVYDAKEHESFAEARDSCAVARHPVTDSK